MWPKLVANKILEKQLGSSNFVAAMVDEEPVSTENAFLNYQKHQLIKYKVFVSTWNVGGVSPNEDLNLQDWLDTTCDIYVFGFQEIVPLRPSNILGPENRDISMKWNSLIREALNQKQEEEEEENPHGVKCRSSFKCIVSKQMAGIMISVWARTDLLRHITTPHVSCIPCGLMGFFPNKGSVCIRFGLHATSFCFVCTHLTSGGRDGDQQCRNDDVAEILSRKFPNCPSLGLPRRILDHEYVHECDYAWRFELQICLPEPAIQLLVNKREWDSILENDQLRVEMRNGGVLEGWHEGTIAFPPTYKYCLNSDEYARGGKGANRRAPAWCDRIIWCGNSGVKQVCYERGESKLSDHRPVKAVFIAQVSTLPSFQGLESLFQSPMFQ